MPQLNIEQFGDLLQTTLSKFTAPDYTNLITDLTDHPAAKMLIRKNQMKAQSGKNIDFKVRVQTGNSFRLITPTTHDSVNIVDGFVDAQVNYRKAEVKYAFLEEEMVINRGESELVDLIKAREDGAKADWIEGFEGVFWNFPAAADTTQWFGLPYWCTKNGTEGFTGGIPSGYSLVATLSPTTYPRWNNWAGPYTNVTLDDLLRKARKMSERTDFKPMIQGIPDLNTGSRREYFTNLSVKQTFEDLADSRNMNIGPDLAKYDNKVLFRGAAVNYAPKLDADTTGPFYQIDWGVIKIVVLANMWQKRKVISPYPGQRNMSAVFLDTMGNIICFNRRMLGVLSTGTSYPS